MDIGNGKPCYIIAEGGVAHHGHSAGAQDLVRIAKECGADAIKFQIYNTKEFISKQHQPVWFERYKSKELSYDQWEKIKAFADKTGITFLATAHDDESFKFVKSLDVPMYKIGSGELGNWDYIKRVAKAKKPVVVSTGMYTKKNVEKVFDIFEKAENPDLILMHCVTAYPTLEKYANMKRLSDMKEEFGCLIGYSDHTKGSLFPLMAVAMGADVVEKHIMCDYETFKGQDWRVSLTREDFKELVDSIRTFEKGLGTGIKAPRIPAERFNQKWATKRKVNGKMLRA